MQVGDLWPDGPPPRFGRWSVIAPTRYADNFAAPVAVQTQVPATPAPRQPRTQPSTPQRQPVCPPRGPLRHAVLSAHAWDRLRGARRWRALDRARSTALRRTLAGMPAGNCTVFTGTLLGHADAASDGCVHISSLSDPTDDVSSTAKTTLQSAFDGTIVGWYMLNVGVGVQPSPSTMENMCNALTYLLPSLPANRPEALFHMVVVDCVKSQQSTDAHLECFDASGALACDLGGCWNLNISALKHVNWSIEEYRGDNSITS
jgi:hypothetical protein